MEKFQGLSIKESTVILMSKVDDAISSHTITLQSPLESPPVAQRVKRLPATQETWVRSLGQEDPLEKDTAAHSSTLAWEVPWTEESGGLQSMRPQSRTGPRLHCHSHRHATATGTRQCEHHPKKCIWYMQKVQAQLEFIKPRSVRVTYIIIKSTVHWTLSSTNLYWALVWEDDGR